MTQRWKHNKLQKNGGMNRMNLTAVAAAEGDRERGMHVNTSHWGYVIVMQAAVCCSIWWWGGGGGGT